MPKDSFNNESKKAAALSYDNKDKAPLIVASGEGYIADKILETAKENNVPVFKDAKLADTLTKLDIGTEIPPELYEVVAKILVFVDKTESKYR
ncbi:MAG: EscU/YscU/HrcU family type III secretion system export apparatus switch protein [Lachnospiraceae bacterium]|nr:EscU/YscU/HrcU family type III secretion system export apparatus switch protein [Lachnospiraceae bacterium]